MVGANTVNCTEGSSPTKINPAIEHEEELLPTLKERARAYLQMAWSSIETKCPWLTCCGCRDKSDISDISPLPNHSLQSSSLLGNSIEAFLDQPAEIDDEIIDSVPSSL